jgi:hypothetical protein
VKTSIGWVYRATTSINTNINITGLPVSIALCTIWMICRCTLQPFTWIVAMFFKAEFRPTNKKEYFVAKFVIN